MKKLLLLVAISLLSFTSVKAQLNPIKNLNYATSYIFPNTYCPEYNCFWLSWSKPDSSLTDTLIGYNIYRDDTLYQFVNRLYYGCSYNYGYCDATSGNWWNPNNFGGFWIIVKAVYNRDSVTSITNDSVRIGPMGIGVKLFSSNKQFTISPNPFSAQTTLQFNEILTDATLSIYNVVGQQVKQLKNINGQTISIERDNLPCGLYFVNLSQNNKIIASNKLVIAD